MENNEPKEVRINNLNPTTHRELQNIAANLSVSVSQLLKPEIKKFVDSYAADMKQAPPKKDKDA